jgi:hypothetical protein
MDLVRALFNIHVISRFCDVPWHPRSLDLSTCDFFLWGFLKSRVYQCKLEDLKTSIRLTIDKIQSEMLESGNQLSRKTGDLYTEKWTPPQ